MHRRRMIVLTAAACFAGPALADRKPWFFAPDGLALSGHDAVAYLREDRAIRGSADHAVMWKGAVWRFSSEDHRAAFEMNPQAYAPQYGGYCAWSVSRGRIASADPEAFAVIDDKLYLTHSQAVRSIWARDPAGFIAGADAHWPALLDD
jgi:YHS domain-containing protein